MIHIYIFKQRQNILSFTDQKYTYIYSTMTTKKKDNEINEEIISPQKREFYNEYDWTEFDENEKQFIQKLLNTIKSQHEHNKKSKAQLSKMLINIKKSGEQLSKLVKRK